MLPLPSTGRSRCDKPNSCNALISRAGNSKKAIGHPNHLIGIITCSAALSSFAALALTLQIDARASAHGQAFQASEAAAEGPLSVARHCLLLAWTKWRPLQTHSLLVSSARCYSISMVRTHGVVHCYSGGLVARVVSSCTYHTRHFLLASLTCPSSCAGHRKQQLALQVQIQLLWSVAVLPNSSERGICCVR